MSEHRPPASWRLLEYASIHDAAVPDDDAAIETLLPEVNWDAVLVTATRHKLVPRLADFLVRSGRMSAAPKPLRQVLLQALHQNRHVAGLASAEASRIVGAMAERGVPIACTKGVVFQSTLYGGYGGRAFDDIDLMIRPEDKDIVAEVLLELGYQANREHDLLTDTLRDLGRRDAAMYAMYPDHLPHFLLPLTGFAIPYYMVDVCFSITWFGSAWQIPMADVLDELRQVDIAVPGGRLTLPGLVPVYDFIFAAMHIFREGWFQRTIALKNLRLGQFADVWRQWNRMDRNDMLSLVARIDKHDIAPPVAWVCHHVDQLLGSRIVAGLGLEDYCDEEWLHSAGAMNGTYLAWTGSMRERIRLPEPPPLVPAPEPHFAASARTARR